MNYSTTEAIGNTTNSQVTIVTGASSGMGKDIAGSIVRNGGRVVLNGRNAGKLEATATALNAPDRIAWVAGSIAESATGKALVSEAIERFGRVDALVNNAGIFGTNAFIDVTEDELDKYLNNNLRGTYFTTQAVVRQLIKQNEGGSIVNIGTVLIDHAISGFTATAALVSKGGVHALTTNLAAELAPHKIRVNMVAPGIIRTPLHDAGSVDGLSGLALLNRVGEVGEITEAVHYLQSAKFVTGHILPVDGGFVSGRA